MDPEPTKVGQPSRDGQFVWDGSRWQPIGSYRLEPTISTRLMQVLAGAYLLLAGILTGILSLLFESTLRQSTTELVHKQNPSFTPDQVLAVVDFSVMAGIGIAVAVGLVYIVLGVLTFAGTRTWLFYVDLVVFGLAAIGVFTGTFALASGTAGPMGFVIPNLVLSSLALGLFAWMLMARIRLGVWACRKVPTYSA
jgi:hypothetical protein